MFHVLAQKTDWTCHVFNHCSSLVSFVRMYLRAEPHVELPMTRPAEYRTLSSSFLPSITTLQLERECKPVVFTNDPGSVIRDRVCVHRISFGATPPWIIQRVESAEFSRYLGRRPVRERYANKPPVHRLDIDILDTKQLSTGLSYPGTDAPLPQPNM